MRKQECARHWISFFFARILPVEHTPPSQQTPGKQPSPPHETQINSKVITVTSGNRGSTTFLKKDNKIIKCPAFAFKVLDKIGAGDTMLAFLAMSVFKKIDVKLSMFISSLAAAFNVESEANSKLIQKDELIRSAEAYLK